MLDLISGFQPVDDGTIRIGKRDVTRMPPDQRAAGGLGRSFQAARLWPSLTVREALLCAMDRHVTAANPLAAFFALPPIVDGEARLGRAVEKALRALGLWGYRDTYVGDLSTGVRRMVELAGLLAAGPKVLLLDEPSSGIAQKETEALGPILLQLRELLGASLVVIEHDMPLLTSIADRVVALESGTVITEGTTDEVLAHPRVVASYLGAAATS